MIVDAYRENFRVDNRTRLIPGDSDDHVSSTMIMTTDEMLPDGFDQRLLDAGLGTRRWWGGGVHRQVAYRRFSADLLPVTEWLAERSIGLPCYDGLRRDEIATICDRVAETLHAQRIG